jgi:hypothetical protein
LVGEAEHLLLDDVGGLTDPAREQLGVFECGRLDPPVAGTLEYLGGSGKDPRPLGPAGGQDVEGAPRGLETGAHDCGRA